MKNDGAFIVYINQRYYWSLDLVPVSNECEESICRCALVDSDFKQEIDAINFDAEWLLPIFSSRSMIGMKEFAAKLKEVTDKHALVITPKDKMPQDKRIKETKHIEKRKI
jgi:hypothetical protein